MVEFNYALDRREYTLGNALLWGNCFGHHQKAKQSVTWGHRIFHVIIFILEYPPIVGQIASIFEMIIVRYFSNPIPTPLTMIPSYITSEITKTVVIIPDNLVINTKVRRPSKQGETSPSKTPPSEPSPQGETLRSLTNLTNSVTVRAGSEISNPGEIQQEGIEKIEK